MLNSYSTIKNLFWWSIYLWRYHCFSSHYCTEQYANFKLPPFQYWKSLRLSHDEQTYWKNIVEYIYSISNISANKLGDSIFVYNLNPVESVEKYLVVFEGHQFGNPFVTAKSLHRRIAHDICVKFESIFSLLPWTCGGDNARLCERKRAFQKRK